MGKELIRKLLLGLRSRRGMREKERGKKEETKSAMQYEKNRYIW